MMVHNLWAPLFPIDVAAKKKQDYLIFQRFVLFFLTGNALRFEEDFPTQASLCCFAPPPTSLTRPTLHAVVKTGRNELSLTVPGYKT